jgi:hypothetical protein
MLSNGLRMAAKKKAKSKIKVVEKAKASGKKVVEKAKTSGKKVVEKAKASGKKVAKSSGKKVAKTLLGRLAQRSAQLIIDSGLLGDVPPERASAKKQTRKP